VSNAEEIANGEREDLAEPAGEVCEANARAEVREESVRGEVRPENIRAVRIGHGANCSSVGSVIDTLFLGAAVGGAIFAAVCAAMKAEGVTVVGGKTPAKSGETKPDAPDEEGAS
jgi:hypothetical protein